MSVSPGSGFCIFYIRTSSPTAISIPFATADTKVLSAVVAAQASHETISAFGSNAQCNAMNGGGAIVNLTIAP